MNVCSVHCPPVKEGNVVRSLANVYTPVVVRRLGVLEQHQIPRFSCSVGKVFGLIEWVSWLMCVWLASWLPVLYSRASTKLRDRMFVEPWKGHGVRARGSCAASVRRTGTEA